MKYFEMGFTEYNGEQEYSYDFLIAAQTKEEADKKAIDYIQAFYSNGKWIEPDLCEYDGGCITVRFDHLWKTTKNEFVNKMLEKWSI
jgi:hypothetical protein